MEELEESCRQASSYPCNLVSSDLPMLMLDDMRQELRRQSERVFCDASNASVDFLEIQRAGQESTLKFVRNADDLRKRLDCAIVRNEPESILRMIFIYAPTARDRLNLSFDMAQQILSYHQVMPQFLEDIYGFGLREHSQDCVVTSFRDRSPAMGEYRRLPVEGLGRSVHLMEHCYGLRSVEPSSGSDWPWSIRLCSVYHALDLESAQATWIVVKANRLVEKLVRDSMASSDSCVNVSSSSVADALAAALHIQGLIAAWSGSKWQWYNNFLEKMLQDITRPTLAVTLEDQSRTVPSGQFTEYGPTNSPGQMYFEPDQIDEKPRFLGRTRSSLQAFSSRVRSMSTRGSSVIAPDRKGTISVTQHQFAFKDLPRVHYIEEKASEALDILSNNEEVLEDLKSHYAEVYGTSRDRSATMVEAYERFVNLVNRTQKDLRTQQSRVRQLLRLIGDRKTLLQGILNYDSMQANRELAEKAGATAKNMEDIAVKTKLETVSMRIITLVTLFFLPGTFISTMMSTPIVTFAPGSQSVSARNISTGALQLFCAVSLPLVVLTFTAWVAVYWWESRKEHKRQQENRDLVEIA